jgi:hypothetical protein
MKNEKCKKKKKKQKKKKKLRDVHQTAKGRPPDACFRHLDADD